MKKKKAKPKKVDPKDAKIAALELRVKDLEGINGGLRVYEQHYTYARAALAHTFGGTRTKTIRSSYGYGNDTSEEVERSLMDLVVQAIRERCDHNGTVIAHSDAMILDLVSRHTGNWPRPQVCEKCQVSGLQGAVHPLPFSTYQG